MAKASRQTRLVTAMALARASRPDCPPERLFACFACREIRIDGQVVADPKARVSSGARFEIADASSGYVGRGGLKLEKALEVFGLDFTGKVALDAGASTGGFTDCLLKHGAKAVHSVDVGYNQLDWSLRRDPRVLVHERRNIMAIRSLEPRPWAAVADLSFRSIAGAAAHILSLTEAGLLVALVKPQFELGRSLRRRAVAARAVAGRGGAMEDGAAAGALGAGSGALGAGAARAGATGAGDAGAMGFHGVINDRGLLRSTMLGVARNLRAAGTGIHALALSPIRGRKGNIEFFALIRSGEGLDEARFEALLDSLLDSALASPPAPPLEQPPDSPPAPPLEQPPASPPAPPLEQPPDSPPAPPLEQPPDSPPAVSEDLPLDQDRRFEKIGDDVF